MAKPKRWNSRDYHKMVKANGYNYVRNNGDHLIYVNDNGRHISIPQKVNVMMARRLVKEYGLDENLR